MKTALTPLLMAIAGIVLCVGSQAVAQDVYKQQPTGPYAEQLIPVSPQYDNGVADGDQPTDGMIEPGQSYLQAPDGGMMDDGFMIDNGLWDGALVGPCCANCGGGSGCPPDWYTKQGVRILTRSRPRNQVIGSTWDNNVGWTAVLSSKSAAPDVSAAYAMTIGHYFARDTLNRDHFVEFTYWGANGWKDKVEHLGNGDLFSEFMVQGYSLTGFDYADLQSTYYASYTNNFELNGRIVPRGQQDRLVLHPNGKWRRECQPGTYMSYIYGLRFFQDNETFRFHSESTTGGTTYTGDYDIVSHNNLLGFQFGADMTFRKCRWDWGIRVRLGPYINFSDQASTINSGVANAPTFSRRLAAAKHEASLIGEVGFFATHKFRPNLVGHVGYDFMWVSGMTLAVEQLQFNPHTLNQINTNGNIFYHGLSLSLEWLW